MSDSKGNYIIVLGTPQGLEWHSVYPSITAAQLTLNGLVAEEYFEGNIEAAFIVKAEAFHRFL
jgi:hypothetical protein